MKCSAIRAGSAWLVLAGCDRGPDAVIPPPWHPASIVAPVAPPIKSPEILDEPADTKPVPVRQERAPVPAPKTPSAPAPAEGGHVH